MPPKPSDAENAAAKAAEKPAAELAAAAEAAEKAVAEAAEKAADKPAAEASEKGAAAPRVIGTVDAPSKATSKSALKKLGIEVLAEAKSAEGFVVRVLQDAKRAWKEYFHEA